MGILFEQGPAPGRALFSDISPTGFPNQPQSGRHSSSSPTRWSSKPKEDVSSGVLTVRPYYEGDRKKKAKSFYVHGEITLRVRDFSKLGPILEGSAEDGITDFRSLTYSLSDEEAAKQKAVAVAMKHALGRATAALESKGQKMGGLRFANIDVKQLTGLQEMSVYAMQRYATTETVEVSAGGGGGWGPHKKAAAAPPPPTPVPQPEKISVSASVQCAFQIL
jgi:hypothetical protein